MSPIGNGLLLLIVGAACVLAVGVLLQAGAVLVRHRVNVAAARLAADRRSRWEPYVLEALVGDRSLPEVHFVVRSGEERAFCEFLQGYGRRLAGVDLDMVLRLAEPFLWAMRQDLVSPSPEVRARAVQMLSDLGFADHKVAIIQALDDPSPMVAVVAAGALTRPGHPELATHVVGKLHRFENWDRGFVAGMVASSGPAIGPELRNVLADPRGSSWERAVAADALRLLSDPEAADPAAHALADTEDPEVTAACLRLLRQVGRAEHAPAVRRFVAREDFATRAHAFSALGTIGGPEDAALARSALFDPSPWVALHAGRALLDLGEAGALESLARLDSDRRDLARELLAEAKA